MKKRLVIIEIGSNNTKTHVYEGDKKLEDINNKIDEYENEQMNSNDLSIYSTEQNSSNIK